MSNRSKNHPNVLIAPFLFLLLLLPVSSFAGAALDTVKGHTESVLKLLRDPSLRPESAHRTKMERLRAISDRMFDFTELSRRTLAKNWEMLTPDQQWEFIRLYKRLLEDVYAARILAYSDEQIVFAKEIPLTEKTCEIQSTVVTRKGEIPICYRVISKNGEWKVYDVIIEGVSLINNYRTQFREILKQKSPDALLETMKKKGRS